MRLILYLSQLTSRFNCAPRRPLQPVVARSLDPHDRRRLPVRSPGGKTDGASVFGQYSRRAKLEISFFWTLHLCTTVMFADSLHAFAQFHQSSIERFNADQSEAGELDVENHINRGCRTERKPSHMQPAARLPPGHAVADQQ